MGWVFSGSFLPLRDYFGIYLEALGTSHNFTLNALLEKDRLHVRRPVLLGAC